MSATASARLRLPSRLTSPRSAGVSSVVVVVETGTVSVFVAVVVVVVVSVETGSVSEVTVVCVVVVVSVSVVLSAGCPYGLSLLSVP